MIGYWSLSENGSYVLPKEIPGRSKGVLARAAQVDGAAVTRWRNDVYASVVGNYHAVAPQAGEPFSAAGQLQAAPIARR
jgi:hypothetical protein